MIIKSIAVQNFKNIKQLAIEFIENINCLVGQNGIGKTNLLDAIYYLSFTKSAFSSSDLTILNFESDFFRISGDYQTTPSLSKNVTCSFANYQKKKVFYDEILYEKITEHIGKIPLVFIAPDDTDLIRDASETRRKFFDSVLSQLYPNYLTQLIAYQYYLKQRNALLKSCSEKKQAPLDLFEIYDQHLIKLGTQIHIARKNFTEQFKPIFYAQYEYLASNKEQPCIIYESDVENSNFEQLLKNNFQKDLILQRTTKGIHSDDFIFQLDQSLARKTASQGQKKSFVIALKLAQFVVLNDHFQDKPILLMDDIFDKLDDERIGKLIELAVNNTFGQVFITDARPERSQLLVQNFQSKVKIIHLTESSFENITT